MNNRDSGWYEDSIYSHSSSNTNYFTGDGNGPEYRSFFVFDLPAALTGTTSGKLVINETGCNTSSSGTYTLYDVTTPVGTLTAGGSGKFSIWADLGSGTSYGTRAVTTTPAAPFEVDLSAAAVQAIKNGAGGPFAIGSAYSPNSGGFILGCTSGRIGDIQLVLSTTSVNAPPVADAGADQTIEATSPLGTEVTLDASGSSDPDGDVLTYSWALGGTELSNQVAAQLSLPLGTSTLTLTVTDPSGESDTDEVVVTVTDTTAPALALIGDAAITLECPADYEDPGTTATDNGDPVPAVSVVGTVGSAVGTYILTYTASDAYGNTSDPVVRTVDVVDTTPPAVALNGAATVEVVRFSGPYADPGATAYDACEGALPAATPDVVDTALPGTYTLAYAATDAAGNTGAATRTVYVVDDASLLPAYALLADHHLKADRATTSGALHANRKVDLKGNDGEGAHAGSLTSSDEVKVKDEQTVAGDVTAPKVRVDHGALVSGAVAELSVATVALPALPAIEPGREKVDLKQGQDRTLAPGAYGDVKLDDGAVIRLSTGLYVFDKLDVKDGSRVEVDLSAGPVEIRVDGHVTFDHESSVELLPLGPVDSRYLTVYADGHVDIKHGSTFAGTVVAPGDHVHVDHGSTLTGSVAARDIDVKQSTFAFHDAGFVALAGSAPITAASSTAGGADSESAKGESPAEEASTMAAPASMSSVEAAPDALTLEAPYPNPTRGRATLRYGVPTAGPVTVAVYDVRGREVRSTRATAAVGWHEFELDTADLPSGLYMVRVVAGADVQTGRLTVIR
ncbi:immunoglobulin-like domain-containing protein [Rubrivirga sp. IMCC45206]|uniref:immunoglobulin-like domain-containing protein n=1 Tax=Rubrivirga sp. IMCC45206 TaxID=3391614 RepID=UPI00398FA2F8